MSGQIEIRQNKSENRNISPGCDVSTPFCGIEVGSSQEMSGRES
jgi:hypothetical protein